MRVKMPINLVSGIFFLLFSIALFLVIPGQIKVMNSEVVTSRTFPYLLALLLMVMSMKQIAATLIKYLKKQHITIREFDLKVEAKALLLFLFLIIYLVLMPLVGFLLSSLLMVSAFLIFFRTKNWISYVVVLGSTISVYYIFRYFLNVQLL